ncbi:MAG TPA: Snf7 family protein [Nitrososphaeraceae archaeon]|jgi:division protein CdvB (Snf7/Vps24/ESCRT-III family)|nr:Snf7 family protein [Nitrososphaeraceae archaeon]
MSFNKRWVKPTTNQGVTNKLLENKFMDNIKSPVPLKPKIEDAQKKLQLQISKLDGISNKMHEKDNLIFKRIVYAMQNHDSQYAKVLSNELSQIRKMDKMVCSAKLAMEQIQLRLNTITELGDVVVTLSPAMSVIKGIQGGLSSMMPEADQSFGQISDLLSNIMNDSSQIPNTEISGTGMISEDSMKILEEASMVVEQSMKDKFPDLPSSSDIDQENSEASIY